jgi:hypothetical protein
MTAKNLQGQKKGKNKGKGKNTDKNKRNDKSNRNGCALVPHEQTAGLSATHHKDKNVMLRSR